MSGATEYCKSWKSHVWLVGLEFKNPVNTIKAMSSQSVYPNTLSFLNQQKVEIDDCIKSFMINLN